mmetsp:Transcript_40170/g.72760  ORF Transcript_40170/g.72760 Transcript_40170/m.72760 type:complete len:422 (-) Transcript_40170:89-1354(-)
MGTDDAVQHYCKGAGIRSALRRTNANPEFEPDGLFEPPPKKESELEPGRLPPALVLKCRAAVDLEGSGLPRSPGAVSMARRRPPRSRSEALLKRGESLERVTRTAGLRVLEIWSVVLRPFASRDEIPHLIAAIVHGEVEDKEDSSSSSSEEKVVPMPLATSKRSSSQLKAMMVSGLQRRRSSLRMAANTFLAVAAFVSKKPTRLRWDTLALPEEPDKHPVPPKEDPLGAELRKLVPMPQELRQRQKRRMKLLKKKGPGGANPVPPIWEFIEDILQVKDLEESKGRNAQWPDTGERQALRQASRLSDTMVPCIAIKEQETQAGRSSRRAPLDVDLRLRLTGDQAWAGFRSTGFRSTFIAYSPQVLSDKPTPFPGECPGPGTYSPLLSSINLARKGEFNSTGSLRTVGGTLSMSSRFPFPKNE